MSGAPWKFERMDGIEDQFRILKRELLPHDGYFRTNDGSWSVTDSNGDPVCRVLFKGTAKRGQEWDAPDLVGQARARLIAAAPDLYAALEAMVNDEAFEDLCQGIGEEPEWLQAARVALAKARGEE